MKKTIATLYSIIACSTFNSHADERYDHFPALDAPDTQTAICNLTQYNATLSGIVEQKHIAVEDMVKVHELTYTLENAIIRLQQELTDIAANLEKVHLASETLDNNTVKQSGQHYLAALSQLLEPSECQ